MPSMQFSYKKCLISLQNCTIQQELNTEQVKRNLQKNRYSFIIVCENYTQQTFIAANIMYTFHKYTSAFLSIFIQQSLP